MIVGRSVERSRLVRLVADAKDGRSRSLVLRGEAGIGKTALLDYTAGVAGGMRVLRAVGIESEAEIPFAALQLMFAQDLDRLDALPGPQAMALHAAFGTSAGAGDRLMVGAATLALLAELAGDGPLLCLLDDVQWFDQPSVDALLFAVRRLHSDPVATVFAVRDGERPFAAPGIDDHPLPRLDPADAARLLATVRGLPAEIADRVLAESGGNPLAIVELAASTAGTGPLPAPVAPLPAVGRLEEHFRRQIRVLPERTRLALLLAAADQGSQLRTFTAAADRLGLRADDLEPAERGRLVQVTIDVIRFRHPLIRAAAYQDAPFVRRLAAHEALAHALSDPRDADRRAWHVAAAVAGGTDDRAAEELERAAGRAVGRGGPAAAARALERAAQLTSAPAACGRRLIAAARAAYDAGQLDRAASLAAAGAALTVRPGKAAEAAAETSAVADPAAGTAAAAAETDAVAEAGWIRAQVAYERESPAAASALALEAAAPVVASDPEHALAILTEATWCARDAADVDLLGRCGELLGSVAGGPHLMADSLMGFARLLRGDVEAAVPPIRGLLRAECEGRVEATVQRLVAAMMGLLIGEDGTALRLLERHVEALRGQGALAWLSYALEPLALAQLVTGRFRDAEANVDEGASLAGELGQDMQVVVLTGISAWLAAVRGDAAASRRHAGTVLSGAGHHGMAVAQARWALALNDLMAGDPATALDRLDEVCGGPAGRDLAVRAIPDQVEAAVRAGEADRGRRYLPRLAEWARHTGSPVAVGLHLRCEAQVCEGPEAADRFEAALRLDGVCPYDRARTRVAYGEWLRRNRRRGSARTQLTEALAGFEQTGAHGWRQRVRAELAALGDPAPDPPEPARGAGGLTPQELQVVRRAARGLSNREIAAQLFLSPRTVGYHLYKAYPKLGVGRRAELAQLDL